MAIKINPSQGRIQDFKLGGGGVCTKKIGPKGANFFGDISCEKSQLYTKKSNFFQF